MMLPRGNSGSEWRTVAGRCCANRIRETLRDGARTGGRSPSLAPSARARPASGAPRADRLRFIRVGLRIELPDEYGNRIAVLVQLKPVPHVVAGPQTLQRRHGFGWVVVDGWDQVLGKRRLDVQALGPETEGAKLSVTGPCRIALAVHVRKATSRYRGGPRRPVSFGGEIRRVPPGGGTRSRREQPSSSPGSQRRVLPRGPQPHWPRRQLLAHCDSAARRRRCPNPHCSVSRAGAQAMLPGRPTVAAPDHGVRRIFSIALPRASSSTSLSR